MKTEQEGHTPRARVLLPFRQDIVILIGCVCSMSQTQSVRLAGEGNDDQTLIWKANPTAWLCTWQSFFQVECQHAAHSSLGLCYLLPLCFAFCRCCLAVLGKRLIWRCYPSQTSATTHRMPWHQTGMVHADFCADFVLFVRVFCWCIMYIAASRQYAEQVTCKPLQALVACFVTKQVWSMPFSVQSKALVMTPNSVHFAVVFLLRQNLMIMFCCEWAIICVCEFNLGWWA